MGASSAVWGSGGEFSTLSRSGQVAVVGGCLLVSWGCLRPCWRHRMAGLPVCRLPWDPKSTCRHEIRQIQLDICIERWGARQA